MHTVRNIDGSAREDPRQEVERRPEDAADNVRHHEFRDGQIQHPRHHRHQRTRWPDKAADEDGKHAVLMQRMLGFIQQGFVLFHERPAVQRLLKAPAQPEGDPVAEQAADNPGQPRLPEINLAAANQRPKPCHHHGAGQDQPNQRQRFQKRHQRHGDERVHNGLGNKVFQQCLHNYSGQKTNQRFCLAPRTASRQQLSE